MRFGTGGMGGGGEGGGLTSGRNKLREKFRVGKP